MALQTQLSHGSYKTRDYQLVLPTLIPAVLTLLLLVAPVYGQGTDGRNAPTVTPDAPQKGVEQLIVDVIETSKSIQMRDEQLRAAIDTFGKEIDRSPENMKLRLARAAAHVRLREMDEASKDLVMVLQKTPTDSEAWYVYALMKIDATSDHSADPAAIREGIAALKKATELGFSDPILLSYLGNAHHRLGDIQRAIKAYTKAIEGNFTDAYGYRGGIEEQMGNYALAVADFTKLIETGEKDRGVFYARARNYQRLNKYHEAINDYSYFIDRDSSFPDVYLGRAQCYDAMGNRNAAVKDYDRYVELLVDRPEGVAERGSAYIAHGDYDKGIQDIRKAIQLNPGDLGTTYQPTTNKQLSREALAHGEEQLRRMLKDRPAMATYLVPNDNLWTWAVRKFAGEDFGTLIDWDPALPPIQSGAHYGPNGKSNARILVAPNQFTVPGSQSAGKPRSFDELWSTAVFELHNVSTSLAGNALEPDAIEGRVTCEEYAKKLSECELLASQRTRAFYINCYLNWMPSKVLEKTNPFMWNCTDFSVSASDFGPQFYAAHYNHIRAAREFENGNYLESLKYLQKLWPSAELLPAEDQRLVHLLAGNTLLIIRDFPGAVKEFETVLERNSGDLPALYMRGYAFSKLGQFEKALSDYNTALRYDPNYVNALAGRSDELVRRGDEKPALADLNKAIELAPQDAQLFRRRAQLFLNCKDPVIRNLAEALKDAKKSCELTQWKAALQLDVLAAVYAAQSDFDNAVRWQEKAVSVCGPAEKESYTKTLESYKQKQKNREKATAQESGVKVMRVERRRIAA